jgi:ABC-2 type transport system ATP-binding protein
MTARVDTRVDTYSRGMLQRLGIADALVKDPSVLILDEPTTAIDPIGVVEILDMLRDLVRERGMAVLLSSHLLTQVQAVCDRVGIFAAGKLIGVGTVPELAERFGDGSARIEVGFEGLQKATLADTAKVLRSVAGVTDVETPVRTSDPFIVLVKPASAAPGVREAILALASSRSMHLSSIREEQASLDEIYRTAVRVRAQTGRKEAAA